MYRPNILVVCGQNKRRSRTAEFIFKNDSRFSIRSAGLSPSSNRKISEKDVGWADLILVMQTEQKRKLAHLFGHLAIPPVKVLNIDDVYEFMDEELVEMLTSKISCIIADQ